MIQLVPKMENIAVHSNFELKINEQYIIIYYSETTNFKFPHEFLTYLDTISIEFHSVSALTMIVYRVLMFVSDTSYTLLFWCKYTPIQLSKALQSVIIQYNQLCLDICCFWDLALHPMLSLHTS